MTAQVTRKILLSLDLRYLGLTTAGRDTAKHYRGQKDKAKNDCIDTPETCVCGTTFESHRAFSGRGSAVMLGGGIGTGFAHVYLEGCEYHSRLYG